MKIREIFGCILLGMVSFIYDVLLFVYQSLFFGVTIWWWRLNFCYAMEYFLGFHLIANRESQKFPLARDNFICGETPCVTLRTILKGLDIKPGEQFFDLGCGRGQTVFFASLLFDLKATGYELIPTFVMKAKLINCFLKVPGVEFVEDNMLNAQLEQAKVVYLVPTTFTQDFLEQVIERLKDAPAGAYVISVSRPIEDEKFTFLRKQTLLYSWGRSAVYFYRRSEK